jgi:hypothetical protein
MFTRDLTMKNYLLYQEICTLLNINIFPVQISSDVSMQISKENFKDRTVLYHGHKLIDHATHVNSERRDNWNW